jgi:hypothetical protein
VVGFEFSLDALDAALAVNSSESWTTQTAEELRTESIRRVFVDIEVTGLTYEERVCGHIGETEPSNVCSEEEEEDDGLTGGSIAAAVGIGFDFVCCVIPWLIGRIPLTKISLLGKLAA